MAREHHQMILHSQNASLGLVMSSWDTLGITLEHIMPAFKYPIHTLDL